MGLFGPPNVDKLKAKENIKGLTKALGYQKDCRVRQAAAEALAEIGDGRAVKPLILAHFDRDEDVRKAAAVALTALGASAVPSLIDALGDNQPGMRKHAARALGEIGDARAVEPLIATLKDPEADVGEQAAKALGRMGDVRAVEPLIAALGHRSAAHEARLALLKIGAPAVEPLIVALDETDEKMRSAAAGILQKLSADPKLGQSVRDQASAALEEAEMSDRTSATSETDDDDRFPSEIIEALFERRRLDPRGKKILAFAILYEREMAPMVRIDSAVSGLPGPMAASDQLRFLASKIVPGYQPHFIPRQLRIQADTAVVGRKFRAGESLDASYINPLLAVMLADLLEDEGLLEQVNLSKCSALSLSGNSVATGEARMALIVQ